MNILRITLATLVGAFGVSAMGGQQVMITGNPLRCARMSLEGNPELSLASIADGKDMTTLKIADATGATIFFSFDEPCIAKGLNVVAGANLDSAPSRMTLYGRNSASDDWAAIGRFNTGVNFDEPFTNFTGRTLTTTVAYSSYKLEITRIKNSTTLEIAEIQLLVAPTGDKRIISTSSKGAYSGSESATNLWAADGSNFNTSVVFKNVKADYGVENAWIQYTFNQPQAITSYSITANQASNSDSRPKAWELLASDDGENWKTLDMRSNETGFSPDNYTIERSLKESDLKIDFAAVADSLQDMLMEKFYRDWGGGKYLIHAWNADESKINVGYNYWWMAHAIDSYIDAYIRTGDAKYQTRARQVRQGMYTAYDAGRQDLWNSYYDDMEWMNLACIRGYENLKLDRTRWLDEAKQLFEWIWGGWNYDDGSEGGIRWNSGSGTGKNSCSNAPAIIGAAKLYQLTGEQQYLDKAIMIYEWMLTHSRFDDGFIKDAPGNNNREWAFTYNQGTWVGGLLELYRITREKKYYDTAVDLIDKSIDSRWYSPDGIMREQGASDGGLFKGIYVRYITSWVLSGFLDEERQYRYAQYIMENARSLYNCALHKPDWTVMPDWKNRASVSNGQNNGGADGSYHASIALSGLFLCESADMMRRAGLLNDDYSVKNPAVGKAYKHYRVKFTAGSGNNDVQIGAFSLYSDAGDSGVERSVLNPAAVRVSNGSVIIEGNPEDSVDVYSLGGVHVYHDKVSSTPIANLPVGMYLVRVGGEKSGKVAKIVL